MSADATIGLMRHLSLFLSLGFLLSGGLSGPTPARADSVNRCGGLSAAVLADDANHVRDILAKGCDLKRLRAGLNPLQLAIARARVEVTKLLLQSGADPNATDSRGTPIAIWLGSGQRYSDDELLEVAKLLDGHGCKFESGNASSGPGLIVNLAHRHVPRTLAFLAAKKIPGDYSRALKGIARGDDLESIKALLAGGADPLTGEGSSSALFDAAWEGRTAVVSEILRHVTDKQSAKVLAAFVGSQRHGHADTARVFLESGVKPPQTPEPVKPLCQPRELTMAERALLTKLAMPNANGLVGLAGPMNCRLMQECGEQILIDCNSAADGPAYYINRKTEKPLATCGGACMRRDCRECPPPGWTCSCKL